MHVRDGAHLANSFPVVAFLAQEVDHFGNQFQNPRLAVNLRLLRLRLRVLAFAHFAGGACGSFDAYILAINRISNGRGGVLPHFHLGRSAHAQVPGVLRRGALGFDGNRAARLSALALGCDGSAVNGNKPHTGGLLLRGERDVSRRAPLRRGVNVRLANHQRGPVRHVRVRGRVLCRERDASSCRTDLRLLTVGRF